MNALHSARRYEIAKRLYTNMPGATFPPVEGDTVLWGDVENTPEWNFCDCIAAEILAVLED